MQLPHTIAARAVTVTLLASVLLTSIPLACRVPTVVRAQEQPDGSFGFHGSKIFKFSSVGPLAFEDLDGDGDRDMIVIDNRRAQLLLLYQDPEATGEAIGESRLRQPDGFRKEVRLVALEVSSLAVTDIDGDGHVDVLMLGRDTLEVRWGAEHEAFTQKETYRIPDAALTSTSLRVHRGAAGPELFVLGKRGIYHLTGFSRERAPRRKLIPGSSTAVRGFYVCDLNRDQNIDLLTIVGDDEFPFETRLGLGDGRFGPSHRLGIGASPDAWCLVERDGEQLIVSVDSENGRFDELRFDPAATTGIPSLRSPEIYPLDAEGIDEPRLVVADLDGDRDLDIAVTHPKANSILTYLNEGGVLVAAPPAPTLRAVVGLSHGDLDGDGNIELVVTSTEESVVGAARLENGVLGFPEVMVHEQKPRLAAAGRFTASGKVTLAVLGGEKGRELTLLERRDGRWQPPEGYTPLEIKTRTDPKDLWTCDIGGDGRDELLLFIPRTAPHIYTTDENGHWQRMPAPGTLEKAPLSAVSLTRGGDLLVASGNHCRRLRYGSDLSVVYQLNGPTGTSKISCAFEANLRTTPDGEPQPYLVLVDQGTKSISLYGGNGPRPELVQTFKGPYGAIRGGAVVDLDGDGSDEVILLDSRFLAVLRTTGSHPGLHSIFTHQNKRDTGSYSDVVAGDFNGDGQIDLCLIDGAHHIVEIYSPGTDKRWQLALSFPVYESSTFRGARGRVTQPRAVFATDMTDDGLTDLIIIVHDRVMIYPQDSMR